MTRALVLMAEGVEEMEAVIVVDVLRRADWDVTVAGLVEGPLQASRGVRIVPDTTLAKVGTEEYDVLVAPGGSGGVKILRRETQVLELIRRHDRAGKIVAAICAGPLVLQDAGILRGRKATCHPSVAQELTGASRVDAPVVEDGNLVTSQGAGTTFQFALALVARVDGPEKADSVARGMALKSWR